MTEWKIQHKITAALGVIAVLALIYAGVKADRMIRIGAGYKAKIACSEVFVAGRDAKVVIGAEFAGMPAVMEEIKVKFDRDAQNVRAHGPFGLGRARAVYREGYGCTLANAGRIAPLPAAPGGFAAAPWPEAPRSDPAIDQALQAAFAPNTAGHRAVLVAVDGRIAAERYAEGFDASTPFLSWSMAKSVTATLVGAAVLRGYLNVDDPAPVPEWEGDADHSKITWNDILRMQSGLAFGEEYDAVRSDVNRMLFEKADAGGFAAAMPVAHAPGEEWYYSSGTTNLIARTLSQVLAQHDLTLHEFAREAILEPIGAASVVLEPDASGHFIGSSFVYATARDWARLGQLYLQNGVWNGERLLPEGWADYVRVPTTASDNQYGAQFWLNGEGDIRPRFFSGIPEEVYFFSGHEGQYVFIIPDKRMVIVRTGLTRGQSAMQAVAPLVKEIYDAVGAPDAETAGDRAP